MANKYDKVLGEYREADSQDLSGYIKLDQTTPQIITATDTDITATDEIYFGDATDTGKFKKDTVQGILDLVPPTDIPAFSNSINKWCLPGWYSGGVTNGTPGDHIAYIPIFVSETTTFDRIGANVAGTGSEGALIRFGVYNFANGVATTLIEDFGTIDVTTSGAKEIVINRTLARGWYAIAMISNGKGGVLSSMDMSKTRPPVAEGTTSALNTAPQYVLGIALNQTAQCTNGLNATASTITNARDSSMACAKLRKK